MGQDKATLSIGGMTLFERVERVMRFFFDKVIIAGQRSDLARPDLPAFTDSYPACSLSGLHTALRYADTDWVCVLPCDLPYPSPVLVEYLLAARGAYQAVMPQHPDRIEPLIACYHKSCLPTIERRLNAGHYRLTDLTGELNSFLLGPDRLPRGWRRALFNLNQPADLTRLNQPTPAVTFVARSGTGKTTLLENVIRELVARGWTVGALKHDAHRFEIDKEGKDSWRMTRAGAAVTTISSSEQSATIRRHELEPTVKELLLRDFRDVDLVLTEGFKASTLPKIEVYRHGLGDPLLCRGAQDDPGLLAVASDVPLELDVPVFDLNQAEALVTFIERTFLS